MKLATCSHEGSLRAGVVSGDGDRLVLFPVGITVLDVISDGLAATLAAGDRLLAGEAEVVALSGLPLVSPLVPPSVRDFVAFEEHVEGVVRSVEGHGGVAPEWYAAPTFYFTNPHALVGTDTDVAIPPGCEALDFELEVAAVIGSAGSNLTPEEGRAAIVGYTILNDWSARDLQRVEMRVGLGPAKGKDFASTLGPWLVTADELAWAENAEGGLELGMRVTVNGALVGQDLLSNMGWSFGDLVAYASRGTWVRPGDVLGSGTCGNGGCLAELWGRSGTQEPPPLRPGDVVEMTVEGIGSVRNRVVPGVTAPAIPAASPRTRSRARDLEAGVA